ncbi:NACHT domain-containing protein [Nocardiopsis sp. LOL_012]|uniref:NACHT domain-containing protein n=1 Tax=Nocardiopsis sp. LOL_012 TaxID=3345409 RepID=UPI003A87134A
MAQQLTYADALRILGADDPETAEFGERLADGGLALAGVPDLFGLRGALVSQGRRALEGIRDRIRGESRLTRTARIEAAHQILVTVAFFEAVEEALEQVGAPFALADLEFTGEEQTALLVRVLEHSAPGRAPLMGAARIDRFFVDCLFRDFARFLTGLAVAEKHGVLSAEHALIARLRPVACEYASVRYEESYRLLAADIPEFGMWAHLEEHERTRSAVETGLRALSRSLEAVGSDRAVDRRRAELAAGHRAVLRRPVLRSDEVGRGITLPTLEEAYVPPRGRVAYATRGGTPSTEEWWEPLPVLDDLQTVIAGHLVHPLAAEVPTVILGHPGSGKSKFTEMLAARLPVSDFLPIRVELRAVQPNAPIHLQIEEGLTAALHTRVSWRELAESAEGALPVVILDGFDELLQATGVDRSDYLERVQEFQQQQEALGRPVAVIVTSRTVVADRARFPDGTLVMRLEPFDDARIEQMLRVWNRANAAVYAEQGLEPLTLAAVAPYRELAEQPLLLLMLLIYDSADNALHHTSGGLSNEDLYERLLRMFATREVDKHRSGLGREDFDEAVEEELRRLEIAALAMFTRRKQSVTAEELGRDLAVLMPSAEHPSQAGPNGRIDPAARVLGRFFFVHEARAQAADGTASVFEFLHATFGEYLVARAVATALDDLEATRVRPSRRRGGSVRPDDGELYALSSFSCYTGRDKVVEFLGTLLLRRLEAEPGLREAYSGLLVELFKDAPFPAPNRSYSDYEPNRIPLTRREANYTANLVVLLCLVRGEPVDTAELFPDWAEPDQALQGRASLWRSLPGPEWFSLMSALRVRHLNGWNHDELTTVIGLDDGSAVDAGECLGFELRSRPKQDLLPDVTDPYGIAVPHGSVTARLLKSVSMRVNGTAARFTLGILPYLRHVSTDLATWYQGAGDERVWSQLHEVMRLRMEPPTPNARERLGSYRRLLGETLLGRIELLVLRQAAEDLALLSDEVARAELAATVRRYLNGVTEVVSGNALGPGEIWPVLNALGSRVGRERTEHILELARAHRDGSAPAAEHTARPAHRDQSDAVAAPRAVGLGGSAGP